MYWYRSLQSYVIEHYVLVQVIAIAVIEHYVLVQVIAIAVIEQCVLVQVIAIAVIEQCVLVQALNTVHWYRKKVMAIAVIGRL